MAASSLILPYFEGRLGKLRQMRFWSLVEMGPPEACWPWLASCRGGYGRFKVASHVLISAHRVAFAISKNQEPGDLQIRHSCDNPSCCNPAHLLIGTAADNMRDKMERGRWRGGVQAGSANGAAKLSDEQLAILVDRLKAGLNNIQCAEGLPIGHSMVSKIRVGLMWSDQTAALGWEPAPQFNRRKAA